MLKNSLPSHPYIDNSFVCLVFSPKSQLPRNPHPDGRIEPYDLLVRVRILVNSCLSEFVTDRTPLSSYSLSSPSSLTTTSAALDLSSLLDDSRFSDISFAFESDTRILFAHRAILAARSKYFSNLLSTSWAEDTQREVRVGGGMKYETFRHILHYVYSGTLRRGDDGMDPALLLDLYRAADMYMMEELMALVVERLGAVPVDDTNWAARLVFAFEWGIESLRVPVVRWVVEHWDRIEESDGLKAVVATGNVAWLKEVLVQISTRVVEREPEREMEMGQKGRKVGREAKTWEKPSRTLRRRNTFGDDSSL